MKFTCNLLIKSFTTPIFYQSFSDCLDLFRNVCRLCSKHWWVALPSAIYMGSWILICNDLKRSSWPAAPVTVTHHTINTPYEKCVRDSTLMLAFDFSGEVPNYEFGSYNYDVMCIQVILVRVKWTLGAIWYHISLFALPDKNRKLFSTSEGRMKRKGCVLVV